MKGLLLKDWYLMKKYCRSYVLITAIFIFAHFISGENSFLLFYPCIICGMLPVTLLGYDERSRWPQYSATLPYTKSQIVSSKYLICLFAQIAVIFILGLSQGIRMAVHGHFVWSDFITFLLLLLPISAASPAICLPFIFKLGVEKGRIAYYVMVGFVCVASILAGNFFKEHLSGAIHFDALPLLLSVASLVVFALSWYLSIRFCEKRETN